VTAYGPLVRYTLGNPIPSLGTHYTDGIVYIDTINGLPFDALSIDITERSTDLTSQRIDFTGWLTGGGTVTQSFTTDADSNAGTFETFVFDSSFENLTLLYWTGNPADVVAYDNIVIDPVPEPTTLLLLGSGLIGLAGFRKKKIWKEGKMKRLLIFLVCFGMFFLPSVSGAISISLDFNSLPSFQGWIGGGNTPDTRFSVSGGTTLTQNTLGIGSGSGTYTYSLYSLYHVVDSFLPFTLKVRARVLEEEFANDNHFGFGFAVRTETENYVFGIGTSVIQGPHMETLKNETDYNKEYHTYILKGSPSVGYQFYVDNESLPIYSGLPANYTGETQILLGDLTSGQNAWAEVTDLTFTQGEPVPEPATMLLLACGLIGLAGFRRRIKIRRQ